MTPLVCAHCGTTSTERRGDAPWCTPCGIHLVLDEPSGEWTSVAGRAHRQIEARNARLIERTRRAALSSVEPAQNLIPDGWRAHAEQCAPGGILTLALHPPAGPVDAYAYLTPPHAERGWYVRVDNRSRGVDFPLYVAGGARAAYFATLAEAVQAAVTAVRIETRDGQPTAG